MSENNPLLNGKIITAVLFTFAVAHILWTIFLWYTGTENIVAWNVVSSLKESVVSVPFSTTDNLQLVINEPVFYVKSYYIPTGSQVNTYFATIYLIGILLGTALIISGTLRLRSLWFMCGIATLGAILLSFRLEVTFNQLNKLPFFISFFAISLVSYLYNSWISKNSIERTLPVFVLLFSAFIWAVSKYALAPLPLLQISNYSLSVGLVFTFLFIFFISHELIALILSVVSTTSLGTKSTFSQFLVASSIYLLNTGLIYLENSNRIDLSNAVIDPLWLLLLSLIAGLWGFKSYCSQTQIFSFIQSGGWIYAGGGFITLSTVGYLYATDNNPMIELLSDFISISHLVMGIVFLGYILLNFIQPLRQNLAVYKVLYKPPFVRLILARTVAIFGIFILFVFKNYYSLNQYLAGHYNALGDYALATNDLFVAETYYKKSIAYDVYNHKGNYSLASLAQSQGDFTAAGFYFNQAVKKQPTPFAYVGLSESLLRANLYFDAVNSLKNGLLTFPKNSQLATNLSQQFDKSSIVDSTFLYADRAYINCSGCDVEAANLLAFWLENAKINRLDSILQQFESHSSVSVLANKAAIGKKLNFTTKPKNTDLLENKALNVSQFALLYNNGTNRNNQLFLHDSTLNKLINQPENSGYFSDLTFVKAKQQYFFGDKRIAFQQLQYLTRSQVDVTTPYDLTLASWYLNEGLYDEALNFLAKAGDTLSIQNLQLANYESKIDQNQKQYAQRLIDNSVNSTNYAAILYKAPFNPYVVDKLANMLIKTGNTQQAYQLVFDAVQVNTESLLLWKNYTLISLQLGLTDYAADGLNNIERLSSPVEFLLFKKKYEDYLLSREDFS